MLSGWFLVYLGRSCPILAQMATSGNITLQHYKEFLIWVIECISNFFLYAERIICGILPAALQPERTFQGIVLITTEACPMETRSGFFVARRGASARKPSEQVGNGTGGRSLQNSLLGVIASKVE
jgi:hypothetical protein